MGMTFFAFFFAFLDLKTICLLGAKKFACRMIWSIELDANELEV